MNDKFNKGERVYCVFNSSIEGKITARNAYHGIYFYHVKVDDEESFIEHFGLGSVNVVFLHYQLRRLQS